MTAGAYNIVCEQGATFSRTLTYKDSAGAAVDLTNYSAKMDIRSSVGGTLLTTLSSTGSTITLGGAAGTIALALTATVTNTLTAGTYVYDLELTSSGGTVTRLVEGTFTVIAQVTTST